MPKCGSQCYLCDVPIRFDMYVGCSHGCKYCFAKKFEDISKIKTYAEFLDKFVSKEDLIYLEDEELARDVKELYAVNKGEIR